MQLAVALVAGTGSSEHRGVQELWSAGRRRFSGFHGTRSECSRKVLLEWVPEPEPGEPGNGTGLSSLLNTEQDRTSPLRPTEASLTGDTVLRWFTAAPARTLTLGHPKGSAW